jgi:DNA ligase D-like protein (predicted 3'-phosphoesterase)
MRNADFGMQGIGVWGFGVGKKLKFYKLKTQHSLLGTQEIMRFVVHEHHATHLHWDLRLEFEGVLKSWAVPREPPTEEGIKRLAIEVEDHPLDYIDFEGVIEEGYGKGTVKIWDEGVLAIESRAPNKIVFQLLGKKLNGTFTLLKFAKAGEKGWLFFKAKEG